MEIIPVLATPNQTINVTLEGVDCQIRLHTHERALYCDVGVGDIPVMIGAACKNNTLIITRRQFGFPGNLIFIGPNDPVYGGLGTTYNFYYLSAVENDQLR